MANAKTFEIASSANYVTHLAKFVSALIPFICQNSLIFIAEINQQHIMNKNWLTVTACTLVIAANAQQKTLTVKDYERAESFMSYNTSKYIDHASVQPNWLEGDKFWYTTKSESAEQTFLIDPVKKTKILTTEYKNSPALPARMYRGRNEVVSPDGKKSILIKDYNLFVKDIASGQLTQLTTDGIKDYGYATDNAGWKHSDAPILRWSPDSKKIATFQQDQRNSKDMYLVTTNVGAPVLKAWKYPLPGDKEIATIRRVVIDVENPKVVSLNIPADPHRATLSDDISSSGTFDDIDWKADGSEVAFVSTSRDHKQEKFRIANAATGAVREVFEETVKTQYESGQGAINWRYLPASKEIIWYSERDNWGHLYLYDATTGKVKNQITKGNWVVTRLVKVDEKSRTLYFFANGREAGNPYFSHLYKIGFDGKNLVSLTPEEGNHQVAFSPSFEYFIDSYSQPNVPPVTVLRNIKGNLIQNLEKNRCFAFIGYRLESTNTGFC